MVFNFLKPTKKLHLTVLNNDSTIFDQDIHALSAQNEQGVFDILNLHSNFITIIKERITIHKDKKTHKDIKFERAVMRCFNNHIKIFVGI